MNIYTCFYTQAILGHIDIDRSTICRPSFSRSQVKSIFLYSSLGGTQWVDIVHWTIHYRGSDFCLVGHIGAVRAPAAPAPQNITLGNFHEHWPLSRTKIRKWGNCAVFRFMLWVRVEEAAEMSELSLIYLFVLPIVRKPLCERRHKKSFKFIF